MNVHAVSSDFGIEFISYFLSDGLNNLDWKRVWIIQLTAWLYNYSLLIKRWFIFIAIWVIKRETRYIKHIHPIFNIFLFWNPLNLLIIILFSLALLRNDILLKIRLLFGDLIVVIKAVTLSIRSLIILGFLHILLKVTLIR